MRSPFLAVRAMRMLGKTQRPGVGLALVSAADGIELNSTKSTRRWWREHAQTDGVPSL